MKNQEYNLTKQTDQGTVIDSGEELFCINEASDFYLKEKVVTVFTPNGDTFNFSHENTAVSGTKYSSPELLFNAMVAAKLFR